MLNYALKYRPFPGELMLINIESWPEKFLLKRQQNPHN